MSLQVGLRFGLNLLLFRLCFCLCLCLFEGFLVPLHHLNLVGRGSSWTRDTNRFPPSSRVPSQPTSDEWRFSVFRSSQTSPIFCLCMGWGVQVNRWTLPSSCPAPPHWALLPTYSSFNSRSSSLLLSDPTSSFKDSNTSMLSSLLLREVSGAKG